MRYVSRQIRWGDTASLSLPGTTRGEEDKSGDLINVPRIGGGSARVWAITAQITSEAGDPTIALERARIEIITGAGSASQTHVIPIPLVGTFGPWYFPAENIRARVYLQAGPYAVLARRLVTLAAAPFTVASETELPV
jgi:hypothetical protein